MDNTPHPTPRRDALLAATPERFRSAFGGHQLTVLLDDAGYRHLTFTDPNRPHPSVQRITLVTFPGGATLLDQYGARTHIGTGDLLWTLELTGATPERISAMSAQALVAALVVAAYLDHREALESELAR